MCLKMFAWMYVCVCMQMCVKMIISFDNVQLNARSSRAEGYFPTTWNSTQGQDHMVFASSVYSLL